jgi:hypothetical protein
MNTKPKVRYATGFISIKPLTTILRLKLQQVCLNCNKLTYNTRPSFMITHLCLKKNRLKFIRSFVNDYLVVTNEDELID